MTLHDRLPILSGTVVTYTVGCSCGWRYDDTNEEWAQLMADRHHEEAQRDLEHQTERAGQS